MDRFDKAKDIRDKAVEMAENARSVARMLRTAETDEERDRIRQQYQKYKDASKDLFDVAKQVLKKS